MTSENFLPEAKKIAVFSNNTLTQVFIRYSNLTWNSNYFNSAGVRERKGLVDTQWLLGYIFGILKVKKVELSYQEATETIIMEC